MAKSKSEQKSPEIIMEYNFDEPVEKEVVEKVEPKRKKEIKKSRKNKKSVDVKSSKRKERDERLKSRIEAPIDSIIQELLDSEKTFVENITRNAKKSIFSSFYPFPKDVSFLTIGKGEVVVLIIRRHWSTLIPKAFLAFFALFFPFLISYSVPSWFENALESTMFILGLFVFFIMLSVTIILDSFFKWFFGLNMITNKRIIDVDFANILDHRISETTFEQVQDVSHSPRGPLASFFDYGCLYIQTAATKSEFEFNNIPRPRDVQDTVLDLRELRRKHIAKEG